MLHEVIDFEAEGISLRSLVLTCVRCANLHESASFKRIEAFQSVFVRMGLNDSWVSAGHIAVLNKALSLPG